MTLTEARRIVNERDQRGWSGSLKVLAQAERIVHASIRSGTTSRAASPSHALCPYCDHYHRNHAWCRDKR